MSSLVKEFVADQSGATAIEYALIAGTLSIVIAAVVTQIGTEVNAKFTLVHDSVKK